MPCRRSETVSRPGTATVLKKTEIGALPLDSAIELAALLDNDTQCPCGIRDISKKELSEVLNTCGCRPATIIELMAYLKKNEKRVEQLGQEFIRVFAVKHQGDIFRRLNNKQKDLLKLIAACERATAEENINKQLPDLDIEAVAASLRSIFIIKAVSVKTSREFILHPLMKSYIEKFVLKKGVGGVTES